MNVNQTRKQLINKIMNRTEEIIEDKAKMLASFIQYEISVANTELSMLSEDHGYDFKCLSSDYAQAILITPSKQENGCISVSITIPQYALKNVSDSEIEYFKTFVLANAVTKFKRMS